MDADFIENNLAQVWFKDCELTNVVFDNTDLEKADFSTAKNCSIHPIANNIKKASFSQDEIAGLLDDLNIVISQ